MIYELYVFYKIWKILNFKAQSNPHAQCPKHFTGRNWFSCDVNSSWLGGVEEERPGKFCGRWQFSGVRSWVQIASGNKAEKGRLGGGGGLRITSEGGKRRRLPVEEAQCFSLPGGERARGGHQNRRLGSSAETRSLKAPRTPRRSSQSIL